MDYSLSGSSVHGIFQEKVLEWVAISLSKGFSNLGIEPWSPALQADALPSELPGKPNIPKTNIVCKLYLNKKKGIWNSG